VQREEIVAALTALGARLSVRGIEGELYVMGGSEGETRLRTVRSPAAP
jgi:hypothetical protein